MRLTALEQSPVTRTVKWCSGMLTALATIFGIVLGTTWIIVKPHAEEFIKETVEERLNKLESNVKGNTQAIHGLSNQVGTLNDSVGDIKQQNETVIKLLQPK